MADNLHRISRVYSAEQRMSKEMELKVAIAQRYLRTMLLLDDRQGGVQKPSQISSGLDRIMTRLPENWRGMLVAPTGKELFAKVCTRGSIPSCEQPGARTQGSWEEKDAIAHLLDSGGVNHDWAKALSDLSHFAEAQANRATDEANQAFRKARALMGLLSATALVVGALGVLGFDAASSNLLTIFRRC